VLADEPHNGSGEGLTGTQQGHMPARTLAPPRVAANAAIDMESCDDLLDTIEVRICPNPVFVIGSPRSGTSVLPWALAHHWDFCTSQETEFLHGIFGRADAVYRGACREPGTFITEHNVSFAEFFSSLGLGANALISSRSNGKRWIDQTPGYTTMAWVLRAMFPGASFIHMIRDGRAVVNSMVHFGDRHDGPGAGSAELPGWATDFGVAVETWKHYVEFALDFGARNPGLCLNVKNENLVTRTEAGFERIFAFLGAPNNGEPAEFFKSSVVNSSFEPLVWGRGDGAASLPPEAPHPRAELAWRDWSDEQRTTFTDIAGELMKSLGYPDLDT
jgi:sulfotransferase family protein